MIHLNFASLIKKVYHKLFSLNFCFCLCFISSFFSWFLTCCFYPRQWFSSTGTTTNFKHFCTTHCTSSRNGLSSILHCHLLLIFHISFGFTFYTIRLSCYQYEVNLRLEYKNSFFKLLKQCNPWDSSLNKFQKQY